MFGLFKTHKSPVRRRVEANASVFRTWYEWEIASGEPQAILVVELIYQTDPTAPDFDREAIDEVMQAVAARPGETPPARVKLIPRMYGL